MTPLSTAVAGVMRRLGPQVGLQVGDYWWIGDICLQCTEITPEGSHLTREVARARARALIPDDIRWCWDCPDCGTTVMSYLPPAVRCDPRCDDCRCPPTLRDPGLPPTERTAP